MQIGLFPTWSSIRAYWLAKIGLKFRLIIVIPLWNRNRFVLLHLLKINWRAHARSLFAICCHLVFLNHITSNEIYEMPFVRLFIFIHLHFLLTQCIHLHWKNADNGIWRITDGYRAIFSSRFWSWLKLQSHPPENSETNIWINDEKSITVSILKWLNIILILYECL